MKTYNTLDLIKDLEIAFFPIRGDDARHTNFCNLITKSLRGYSPETIQAGGERLILNRRSKTFPALAEIITACAAEHRLHRANSQRFEEPLLPSDSTAEHIFRDKQFQDLVYRKDKLLVQAPLEDWIGGARSYWMRKGRLPREGAEMDACRREAKLFHECYEDCVRRGSRWEKLGASIRAKSEKCRGLLLKQI